MFAGVIPFFFVFIAAFAAVFVKNSWLKYGLIIIAVIIYLIWILKYASYHLPDLKIYSW